MITLATLEQATEQEVFNHVAQHLLTQKQRSMDNDGVCKYRYRSSALLKCAAGCLIGDDEYDKHFENQSWNQLVSTGQVPAAHRLLIQALQDVHDCDDPERWPVKLHALAVRYDLKWKYAL